jgi:hypothetical protein
MEERRCDDGDPGPKMFSVLRFCQKRRGEVTSEGEDWKGDESGFPGDFLGEPFDCLCQLGEFLLISVGESSDSGRGIPLAIVEGDLPGVLVLFIRKGCTDSVAMDATMVMGKTVVVNLGERLSTHWYASQV